MSSASFQTAPTDGESSSIGPLSIMRLLAPGTEAEQLRDVIDPELGVDIVSFGLVYDLEIGDRFAEVLITTTTPACPLGAYISEEIDRVLMESGSVDRIKVDITHTPPWTAEMMSDATKRAFGWL